MGRRVLGDAAQVGHASFRRDADGTVDLGGVVHPERDHQAVVAASDPAEARLHRQPPAHVLARVHPDAQVVGRDGTAVAMRLRHDPADPPPVLGIPRRRRRTSRRRSRPGGPHWLSFGESRSELSARAGSADSR